MNQLKLYGNDTNRSIEDNKAWNTTSICDLSMWESGTLNKRGKIWIIHK